MAEKKLVSPTHRFYERALGEAERAEMPEALQVEGLDQELAALRLRLRTAIADSPEDLALMLRGMEVLRRLVATRYGLSKKDQFDFGEFATETLRRIQERGGDGDGVG